MDPESPRELDEADVLPLSSAAGSSRFSMAAMDSLAARQETLTWYGQDPTSHTRRDEEVYAATLNERRKHVRRTLCVRPCASCIPSRLAHCLRPYAALPSGLPQHQNNLQRKHQAHAIRDKAEKAEQLAKFRQEMQRRQADQKDRALRAKKFQEQTTSFLEVSGVLSPGTSPIMIRSNVSPRNSSTPGTRRAPSSLSMQQSEARQSAEDGDGFTEPAARRSSN